MLLRVYTQNIDGLEEKAGVSAKRMVYAHGSLQRATCTRCKRKVDASVIEESVLCGSVATCQLVHTKKRPTPAATATTATRTNRPRNKRRRTTSEASSTACGGVIKPDITFFGETLQDKVRRSLEADRAKADALVVIGTSLSV